MKKDKEHQKTELSIKFYAALLIIWIVFMCLYVLSQCFVGFEVFVSKFFTKLLEFLAAGILPSVFVAYATDCAHTKRKKENYKEFYADSVKTLREMCADLPITVHTCVMDICQEEKAADAEWDKKLTFQDWCSELCSKENDTQIAFVRQELRQIKAESEKILRYLLAYHEWRDEERQHELETLSDSCSKLFYRTFRQANEHSSEKNWKHSADDFARAVVRLFPTELPENNVIKLVYTEKFNADDYID